MGGVLKDWTATVDTMDDSRTSRIVATTTPVVIHGIVSLRPNSVPEVRSGELVCVIFSLVLWVAV